ncbi:MAG: hypothetical protein E6Q43_01905 [Dokdonella sp.]|nr:MAG: hypothetical protein E6Q43_01905 [Dokdonella sp.]
MDTDLAKDYLAALLRELVDEAKHQIPVNGRLWEAADIALAMRVSTSMAYRFAALPDFPRAYRFPSTGSQQRGHGHPRWGATEVMAWWEKYRSKS